MTNLLDSISARANDPGRAIDEGDGKSAVGPAASEADIAAAEKRLGFPLPIPLRQIYSKVGNGGFGPGYGLFDLATLVDTYLSRRDPKTGRSWPARLLPICAWGANIETSIDTNDPDVTVLRHDPNMPKADVATRVPASRHYAKASVVKEACWIEAMSFETWIQDWADGKRLFYAAYAPDEEEDADFDEDEDGEEECPVDFDPAIVALAWSALSLSTNGLTLALERLMTPIGRKHLFQGIVDGDDSLQLIVLVDDGDRQ